MGIIRLSDPKSVSMGNDWYELAEPNHFWMKWRFRMVQKYIEPLINQHTKVFEIGCGNGAVMKQFMEEFNLVTDGCDLNYEAFKEVQELPGNYYLYNIYDLSPDLIGKYDVLLLLDVIEHIDDDKDFVATAIKHLKPGGLLVISVPANQILYSSYDFIVGHKRRYSRKSIHNLLKELNLDNIDSKYWGLSLIPFLVVRKFYLYFSKEEKIKKGFQPPNRFIHWILLQIMKLETSFFPHFIAGASIIAIARKVK